MFEDVDADDEFADCCCDDERLEDELLFELLPLIAAAAVLDKYSMLSACSVKAAVCSASHLLTLASWDPPEP